MAALPRSRTYWLSRALSYRDEVCLHDPFQKHESLNQIPDSAGIVDTGSTILYPVLKQIYQDAIWIVIDRPVKECKWSLARLGIPDSGMDAAALSLQEIKKRAKLVVPYHRINDMGKQIWETAKIPYPYDREWWLNTCSLHMEEVIIPHRASPLVTHLSRRLQ